MRTRYGCGELFVALASEVYTSVAMRKSICRLGIGKMVQHGLLHRELLENTSSHVSCVITGPKARNSKARDPL